MDASRVISLSVNITAILSNALWYAAARALSGRMVSNGTLAKVNDASLVFFSCCKVTVFGFAHGVFFVLYF